MQLCLILISDYHVVLDCADMRQRDHHTYNTLSFFLSDAAISFCNVTSFDSLCTHSLICLDPDILPRLAMV
eukprot:m.264840 g.264840  ORF g.264840 m.264840 type:complete len:71 (+) comp59284_c0_seq1:100-312(+)